MFLSGFSAFLVLKKQWKNLTKNTLFEKNNDFFHNFDPIKVQGYHCKTEIVIFA